MYNERCEQPFVLQVSKLYSPWIGGVERVVQDIAEGIADEHRSHVLVCQPKGRGAVEVINGVHVRRAGSIGMVLSMPLSPSFPVLFRRLAGLADITHLHLPFPLATFCWSSELRVRTGLVVSYHSDIFRQRWLAPIFSRSLQRVLEDADVILVSSPNIMQSSPWLQPYQHKCRVVPFFVDVQAYRMAKDDGEDARQLGLEPDTPIVLFVGRLVYYKGVEYLVRAMAHVNATLVIVGDGPLRNRLERLSHDLDLGGKVHFVGRVSTDVLHKYYRVCQCFVLPSVEPTEAFGLVQLEAMAYGKPVVNTSLLTGVPFVSVHGETGLTVPPRNPEALAEAINRLCEDKDLRVRLGRQARKRVEALFSKDVVLNMIKSVYRELLEGRWRGSSNMR